MRRLWLMCCHLHGQMVNYPALGQSLDVTHPTLRRHIDVYEYTKRLVKPPKLCIRDSGLLTCLLDLENFDKLYRHPAYGAWWEGFAAENILATLRPRGMYGFFRTRTGEEIDLVIERQGKWLGFEFKTSTNPRLTNGNKAATGLLGLDKLCVVAPQENAYPSRPTGSG